MTGPAMSPPPAMQPPPPMMMPMTPVMTAPTRPGGVTFACVSSIVLGALGALFGVMAMLVASFIGSIIGAAAGSPSGGSALGASLGLIIGIIPLAMGILGIIAGAQGLKGAPWARITMIVLFGLGAAMGLVSIGAVFPLAITALDIVAIVMLVNAPARTWFDHVNAPHRTMTPS